MGLLKDKNNVTAVSVETKTKYTKMLFSSAAGGGNKNQIYKFGFKE